MINEYINPYLDRLLDTRNKVKNANTIEELKETIDEELTGNDLIKNLRKNLK